MVCLFLIMATLSVYWQVQYYDFVNFDDDEYITENHHIQKGFKLDSVIWAFTATRSGNWHPLTWLSHMLDYRLFGKNPGGHHLTSLLFHLANTLLLFFVFRKMTNRLWQSGFVAALFALHPLHVESVAWVSERKDVLSTFFWMLTMWSYVRYVEHPTVNRYLLVALFFTFGLMSKPMLVTLPFVLLLMDYWPLNRLQTDLSSAGDNSRPRSIAFRLVWEKSLLFVIVIASCIITLFVEDVRSLDAFPLKARIANALISYANYIGKMLYPYKLAVLYPHPGMLPWWTVAGSCLILVSTSFLAIRVIKQSPYFAVGWLWYIGTLVPVIGLIQIGRQSMADRYTYIPLIGLFIIITWGIPELAARLRCRKIWFAALATVVLTALMAITWKQAGYWENSITLFEHTLKITSNNYLPHNNLGTAMYQQGRTEAAIEHYLLALRIKPDFVDAHNNLGLALNKQGHTEKAINQYLQALRINPDDENAHNYLGAAFYKQGHTEKAIEYYLQALRIKPDYVDAHYNLGTALGRQGRTEEAIEHYLLALRIKPDSEKAHNNLGAALYKKGRSAEAIEHYLQALRINPDHASVHNNLAIALFRNGNIDGAIDHFRKAVRINPDNIDVKNNLKEALLMQQQKQ